MPKFDDVTVQLTGEDGNALGILARVSRAISRAHGEAAAAEYRNAATAGDYDHLLQVTMDTVNVE